MSCGCTLGFSPVFSILSWPRLTPLHTKTYCKSLWLRLQMLVWTLLFTILEPRLITRPAAVNWSSPMPPRYQFTSTLWMLVCWKSSLGRDRSQGLPKWRCQALWSAPCLISVWAVGVMIEQQGSMETEGMIDGRSCKPSSMHDPSLSHRVWAH